MSCADVQERLSAYVDGDLSAPQLREVESHLASCPACRSEEREVRALLLEASSLPRGVAPKRDLWPGIAARIGTPRGARVFAFGNALAAVAAGLALVALVTARGGRIPGPPSTLPVASAETARLAELENRYDQATAELLAAINARRDSLPPETLAAVEEDLRSIDEALGRLRTALLTDPTDPGLNHLLASTHQKKVNALRHVVKLTTQL